MQRSSRPELQALETAQVSSHSGVPHDHALISPVYSLAAVPAVNPEPAYIAASAASQIVTSEYHSQHPEWEEENGSPLFNEVALVSPAPLSLINAFLDRLLFNFLASARSTSLASLRPAVVEVLKPRLAKEAIAGADEELQEFLGGGDDEELLDFHDGQESGDDWDVEMVWKRTRLRCMVYTRLGDMEEEDEDSYIEQEHLEDPNSSHRLSRDLGIVSPAVAIFLTSILEFIGEHALMIAGEAAYRRCELRARSGTRRSELPQRLIVEETDMEKVALNPVLGRLWRSWRKLLRSPRTSISRILSRETVSHRALHGFSTSRSTSRQSSFGTTDGLHLFHGIDRKPSVAEILSRSDPASIPLPLTDYDVAEIEVPGYSPSATTRSGDAAGSALGYRSMSMLGSSDSLYRSQSPDVSTRAAPTSTSKSDESAAANHVPLKRSVRSRSLPTPTKTTFVEAMGEHVSDSTPEIDPAQHGIRSSAGKKSKDHDGTPGDEAVPSATGQSPGSSAPFQGLSVLNAISKHAARELEGPSDSNSDEDSQDDRPTEMERHGHHEDKNARIGGSSKFLIASLAKPREDAQTRYSASSSVPSQTIGDVSPMEPTFIESGEVSPIEPSEDEYEVDHYTPARAVTLTRTDDRGSIVRSDSNRVSLIEIHTPRVEPEAFEHHSSSRAVQGRQRGTEGPTEDDYAKDEKREAFVVLEDVPTESAQNSDTSILSGQDLQPDGTISTKRTRPSGQENGVPTLGPLREMVEAAHDTSDEASSVAPSVVERSQRNQYVPKNASVTSSNPSYATPPLNGNKLSDLRRQLPSVYTGTSGSATERAGVQRMSPSPGGHGDPITPQGRSSESSYRDIRSTYVAPSKTSPVSVKTKARAGSHSGQSAIGPVTSRTSSDGSKTLPDERYRRGSSHSGEKGRDFEDLINSDETIQYTLTPQNMREMEGPDSPRVNSYQSSSKTTQVVGLIRSGRSSTEQSQPVMGRPKAPSISKEAKRNLETNVGNFPTTTGPTFVIHSGPPVKRGPQAQARDARVENENIRDFADFIRSTGPEQVKTLPKLPEKAGSRPTTATNGTRTSPRASPKGPVPTSPRTLTKAQPGLNPIIAPLISENKALKKGGTRLQAREATISRNDESSELIDFIRQGPPAERNDGKHRIPRTVAPFRNTMDSDDMQPLGNGKAKDANSVATTHSSVNSRTGLLDSSNRQKSKALVSQPVENKPSRFNEPTQPPSRKQRRVRDPYAFEDSDEDEASHTPTAHNQEESLLDFLNSVAPPEANIEPSPLDIRPTAAKGLQRKTSASMRSRFSRSGSSSTSTKTTTTTRGSSQVKTTTSTPIGSYRGSGNTGRIQEEPSYPTQQSYRKAESFSSSSPGQASNVERQRNGFQKPVSKPIQARPAARNDTDSMRDLADFLKNSGPPEPVAPSMATGQGMNGNGMGSKEESGGFARMFSRRKRSVA
ncbi:hypothetical protein MMC30_004863 [Trapelia coarctata]|nr:hypothetical protein [Trapelia coarctata]